MTAVVSATSLVLWLSTSLSPTHAFLCLSLPLSTCMTDSVFFNTGGWKRGITPGQRRTISTIDCAQRCGNEAPHPPHPPPLPPPFPLSFTSSTGWRVLHDITRSLQQLRHSDEHLPAIFIHLLMFFFPCLAAWGGRR